MEQLIRAICPEFPKNKDVKETNDKLTWYMIEGSTPVMRVPTYNYLKHSVMEIDRFSEAVQSFALYDAGMPEYNWDTLELSEFYGADCVGGLVILRDMLQGKRVAVDIETRRIEYDNNFLLSIGFAYGPNSCVAFYDIPIPGAKCTDESIPGPVCERTYNLLQEVLTLKDVIYIWHNGKFDVNRLKYMCGLDARVDEDTMLKHYACINEKRGTHGLKDLGPLYLQAPQWDDELDKIKRDWCRKNKVKISDFTYDLIPIEVLIPYMQRDCIATYRLLEKFEQLARPESDFIYRTLIKASDVFGELELNGMQVNIDYLHELEKDLGAALDESQKMLDSVSSKIWNPEEYKKDTLAKTATSEFNIKSPKQLKWMLEKVIGRKVSSTDAATLDELQQEVEAGAITSPLAKDFLSAIAVVRKNNKYIDTYVNGIFDSMCRDKRIRCTYNLHGTETGRLSCTNPNMQNIPRDKKIKNIFCARDRYKLVQLDYSQAELRVLALVTGDEYMIQAYKDGKDFHDAVATEMFGPNFDKEQRTLAKTINFGIAYGRGPGNIAQTFHKSMSEAKAIIEKWYAPMPKVKKWIADQRKKPLTGEKCDTIFGRERHFVVTNENINHVQNEYVNTPIQSIASDFTMLSIIEIHKFLKHNNLQAKIVATVHDSIVLEVIDEPDVVNTVVENCIRIMAETPKKYVPECEVPFKADAETGYSWGALSEWDMQH